MLAWNVPGIVGKLTSRCPLRSHSLLRKIYSGTVYRKNSEFWKFLCISKVRCENLQQGTRNSGPHCSKAAWQSFPTHLSTLVESYANARCKPNYDKLAWWLPPLYHVFCQTFCAGLSDRIEMFSESKGTACVRFVLCTYENSFPSETALCVIFAHE